MTSSSDNSSPAYKSCTGWFSYSGEEISQYAATMVSKMGRNTSIDLRLHFQAELGLTRYLVSDEVAGGEVEKLKPFSDKRPVGPLWQKKIRFVTATLRLSCMDSLVTLKSRFLKKSLPFQHQGFPK
mmetsp:Transcript_31570/g.122259  ORF Transcript_31570/g.122259 Transcript_31570/m.122259 type:complete len:126 (-) Transcript_31570:799-1176(-)